MFGDNTVCIVTKNTKIKGSFILHIRKEILLACLCDIHEYIDGFMSCHPVKRPFEKNIYMMVQEIKTGKWPQVANVQIKTKYIKVRMLFLEKSFIP